MVQEHSGSDTPFSDTPFEEASREEDFKASSAEKTVALPPEQHLTPEQQKTLLNRQYWATLYRKMLPTEPSTPVVTKLLVMLAIIYLVTTVPSFNKPQTWALEWGILYAPWVWQGEIWRLVTGQLMHGNLTHLLSNGFGIWIFGRQMEALLEAKAFQQLIWISAAVTALFTVLWEPNGSIGASGVSYGILTANLTLVMLMRREMNPNRYRRDVFGMALLAAAYVWMNLTTAQLNIWGHLGGALAGLGYALVWFNRAKQAVQEA